MAIFKIEVTAIAKTTYTVEVDAPTEAQAESVATSREIFNASTPEEFQVDAKNCEFEFYTEQLTDECPECGLDHPIPTCDTKYCFDMNHEHKQDHQLYKRFYILVDGVCTPAPWWVEDLEYCASCGAKIEAREAAEAVRNEK
jgi:predicted RNA-binding Zn-ribbon protein involved in translation (DUF1610 family)